MPTILLLMWLFYPQYNFTPEHKIDNFPLEKQPDHITCGPTSALMILKYRGIFATLSEVKAKSNTEWFQWDSESIGATSPDYLVVAIKQYGINASLKNGSQKEVKHYVSRSKPVIVLLRSGRVLWHYVVVIGYDENFMYIANPASGCEEAMPIDNFLSSWAFKTDMEGLLVSEPCPICNGKGQIFPTILGRCDACGGTGIGSDLIDYIVRAADVRPFTYIVCD